MLDSAVSSTMECSNDELLRIMIKARDVSLTLEHQKNTSILNIFKATVDGIYSNDDSQVTVKASVNGVAVLAIITQKSSLAMNLTKGCVVYLQVKSVALV